MRDFNWPARHSETIKEWIVDHPEHAFLLETLDAEITERDRAARDDKTWHHAFLRKYRAVPVTFWLSTTGPATEEDMLRELRELDWCHVDDTRRFAQARRWPGYPDIRLSKPPSHHPLWVEFKANGDALRVEQLAALPSWSDVLVVSPAKNDKAGAA